MIPVLHAVQRCRRGIRRRKRWDGLLNAENFKRGTRKFWIG